MEYHISRVSLLSVIKVVFLLSLLVSIIFGVFHAGSLILFSQLITEFTGDSFGEFFPGAVGMTGILIFFISALIAVLTSIFAVIFAGITAVLYNLIAGVFGGIKVQLSSVPSQPQIPASPEEPAEEFQI